MRELDKRIACDACEGNAPAAVYVEIDQASLTVCGSLPVMVVENALYLCPGCVLKVRDIIGSCDLSFSKPDDDKPDGAAVVTLEAVDGDGGDLEEWDICGEHAGLLSKLRIRPLEDAISNAGLAHNYELCKACAKHRPKHWAGPCPHCGAAK